MKLVFFGDSLTDMYRNFDKTVDMATSYGTGFVFDVAAQLMYERPGFYQIINRGQGGNKVSDLYARYMEDIVSEKPDVLTVLVGVNDVWHELITHSGTPIDVFEETYNKLIKDLKEKLPQTTIILMEPFFLYGSATKDIWEPFQEVLKYAEVCKKVAERNDLTYIYLQKDFEEAIKNGGSTQFLFDGLHTNPAGAHLIATKWLKVFKTLIKE